MTWLAWIVSNLLLASVLALAAWLMQRWLRRPAVAHLLWVLALVKLVTPPLVSVPVHAAPGNLACLLGTCGCASHPETPAVSWTALPWFLLGIWGIGAAATACMACHRWLRLRRLLAHATPAPAEWQDLAARLADELSLRRPPQILAIPGRLPPLVIPGRPRPLLLLPMELMNQIQPAQRAALLLHELTHLQRGDHLVRLLEMLVGVVYWWLPFVGTIGRQLRSCEESCCDTAVVTHRPQARRAYAQLLLDVLDFTSPLPGQPAPQATAMSAAQGLEQRLLTILDTPERTQRTGPAWLLALALACVILPCQLRYLPLQQPATEAPADVCVPAEPRLPVYGCCAP